MFSVFRGQTFASSTKRSRRWRCTGRTRAAGCRQRLLPGLADLAEQISEFHFSDIERFDL